MATLLRPQAFRLTSAVHHLDRVGWQAVPIILLITFLIGGIIAQQGFFHFRKFGADEYVVDMVGILVLREIGVLIVAIMVAGRSGSSYTAELGSMKMREEIDALRTMGFDPVEVLILPRIIALVLALPLLTFLGSMAALYGGGLVAWLYGGMSPEIFIARLNEAISVTHFKVGMIKAPFMALVDRRRGLLGGAAGEGQRRVARAADHHLGRQIDLPGDRARRPVRHLLRLDRDVSAAWTRRPSHRRSACATSWSASATTSCSTISRLDVRRGEILGFVGGSGSGKSVLLRTIIGLLPKRQGAIEVLGVDLDAASEARAARGGAPLGRPVPAGRAVLLADGAAERAVPHARISGPSDRLMDEIALAKLEMVGLDADDADKFPSELSGGMTKRVALARALALDPEIVFLDEPTSGLDPIAAGDFDELIRDAAADAGPDRVHGHARSRQPLDGLRPRGRAGRRQGGGGRADLGDGSIPRIPGCSAYFQGKRGPHAGARHLANLP